MSVEEMAPVMESIISHEGSKTKVYKDTKGNPTVGVGYKLTGTNAPQAKEDFKELEIDYDAVLSGAAELTPNQVDALTIKSVSRARAASSRIIKNFESQPDSVKDVVTEMVFQLGPTGFKKFKKTIAAIEEGDYEKAADELEDSQV